MAGQELSFLTEDEAREYCVEHNIAEKFTDDRDGLEYPNLEKVGVAWVVRDDSRLVVNEGATATNVADNTGSAI